ncbi:phage tail protein [uncultured Aquitalea sp.]|uniref:phage tail protein n=1 Tax=uncultured Aquitalea sp. TaxID=540272 RepID=UPI0025FE2AFF|nr:phage tail protein [uncultured Aquitalea sp.]
MRRSQKFKRKTGTAGLVNSEGSIFMAGEIVHFAGGSVSVPVGWLKCNGAAVSRSTYAALYAVLGTLYGAGDGVNTFNLPDYRGEFLRGLDDGRGVDAGRMLGAFQADDLRSHGHAQNMSGGPGTYIGYQQISGQDYQAGWNIRTAATGGSETRPRNVAALVLIKY